MQFRSCTPKIHKYFESSMAFRCKIGAIFRPRSMANHIFGNKNEQIITFSM